MTDIEILQQKLNLEDSILDNKGKEEFLMKTDDFHNIFSLQDEIETCPFMGVHPIFCKTIPYERGTKESNSKGNG